MVHSIICSIGDETQQSAHPLSAMSVDMHNNPDVSEHVEGFVIQK
jgi:hypothetical protein